MIKLESVKKKYRDFDLDISMEIPSGRVTGLIGKNGSGKSTTIKSILGLIKVDEGKISVIGKDINSFDGKDRREIGVALADSSFSIYLNINNIASILEKMYDDFDRDNFISLCNENGLACDKPLQKFSTGMRAKLRVLVAISHGAKLLIMDEPTAGMDVEARNEIISIIRDYLNNNPDCSMLITSHIATDLEGICDDVYLIDGGRVVLHEDMDVIVSNYGVLKLDQGQYDVIDKKYIEKVVKEKYFYKCLTKDKKYYQENYPDIVCERCGIDDIILMLTGVK